METNSSSKKKENTNTPRMKNPHQQIITGEKNALMIRYLNADVIEKVEQSEIKFLKKNPPEKENSHQKALR